MSGLFWPHLYVHSNTKDQIKNIKHEALTN